MKIKNKKELLSHGDIESRQIVLQIAEETLERLDAYNRIRSIIRLEGHLLIIGKKSWDLSKKRHIYLIGAGKACNAMAKAVEEALGEYLTDGIAIVKVLEEEDCFRKIRVYVGGHPIPNEEGVSACRQIEKLIMQASHDDLFLCVMSGGSSALMSLPLNGISLEDEREATDLLLKSGANIIEINAVRRHISAMNGGRLAEMIASRGTEMIGFNISDSISGVPTKDITIPVNDMYGTPICPDQTTLEDALATIRNYDLSDRMPTSILYYLNTCGTKGETPKHFSQNTYYQINTLPDSCVYAKDAAEKMGIQAVVLTSFLEGEAKDAGGFMAAVAKEIQKFGQPVKPPCIVISAGEVVTTIRNNQQIAGHGGPSQEMTLGFGIAAADADAQGICLLSMDSEGTDGTAFAAGGITDSQTFAELAARGVDIFAALRYHGSFEALSEVGCAIITGNTGTNVCDINIMYVPESSKTIEKR